MYSQCPECQTWFRVTAVALRAAHGTVRCGRCGSAFDALPRLSDTLPDDLEPAPSARTLGVFDDPRSASSTARDDGVQGLGVDADSDAGTEFHFSADDIERVFVDARDWQQRFPSSDVAGERRPPAEPAADESSDGVVIPGPGAPVVFVHEPEAIEDITLEGERVVIEGLPELDDDLRDIVPEGEPSDDAVPLPDVQPPPHDTDATDRFEALRLPGDTAESSEPVVSETVIVEPVVAEPVTAQPAAAPPITRPARVDPTAAEPAPVVPYRLRQHEFPVETGPALDDDAPPRRGGASWAVGVLLLLVVLAAQVVHHFRQELARDASLGPLVRSAYARLGRPLAPNWDLAAFELRQWGPSETSPAAPGTLEVRASLRNGAPFAQPLPLLRLELEDRFGETVARRDFEPAEYLNDPAQAPRMLATGATTEAALTVVDQGSDAVGYRLDVCMRDEAAVTHCAQSLSRDRAASSP
jgi:predicted Zn finger-like uncharacterized protein